MQSPSNNKKDCDLPSPGRPRFNIWIKMVMHPKSHSLYLQLLLRKHNRTSQQQQQQQTLANSPKYLPVRIWNTAWMSLSVQDAPSSHESNFNLVPHSQIKVHCRHMVCFTEAFGTDKIRAAIWRVLMNHVTTDLELGELNQAQSWPWDGPDQVVAHKGVVDPIVSLSTSWWWLWNIKIGAVF